MKNIIGKVFNLFIYANLAFAIASFGYMSLPVEYQFLNDLPIGVLLIGGGSTTLIGSAGLYFKAILNRHGIETNDKIALALEKQLEVNEKYSKVEKKTEESIKAIECLEKAQLRTNKLLETELKARLDNPLVNDFVKDLIEGVLNED